MPEGQTGNLVLILVCILASAFFSSAEAAFLSLQRTRIAHLVSKEVPGAGRVSRMMEHPERLLSTILLGDTVANVAFAALVTIVIGSMIGRDREGLAVIVATGAGATLLLVAGEIVPKAFALRNAQRVAFLYARPLQLIETLLLPLINLLHLTTRVARLGSQTAGGTALVTEAEFRSLIDIGEAEGTLEEAEAEMLDKVFRFGDRQVREVMTPRTEIVFIERGATINEFLAIYAEHAHTRFPVYKDNSDNVVGILSAKDVLKALASGGLPPDGPITDLVRDVYFVPETKRIAELFEELRQSGNPMAIAVDEFGGVAGFVTLTQLIEEVMGRVGEEGALPEEEYQTIDENTFQVEGGMDIGQAGDELGIAIPDGDYDTVAGFVLQQLGHIPLEGERFDFRDLRVEVVKMNELKIETVKITRAAKRYGIQAE